MSKVFEFDVSGSFRLLWHGCDAAKRVAAERRRSGADADLSSRGDVRTALLGECRHRALNNVGRRARQLGGEARARGIPLICVEVRAHHAACLLRFHYVLNIHVRKTDIFAEDRYEKSSYLQAIL